MISEDTHTYRRERVIKEVINHREQCQRAITLPLSKHCSHSALLAGVVLSPRLQILASPLKIITKIRLRLPEVLYWDSSRRYWVHWRLVSQREYILFSHIHILDIFVTTRAGLYQLFTTVISSDPLK